MPPYMSLPSKDQWKKDLGLHTVFGNYKSPFPAMERIGKLLAEAERLPAPASARRAMDVAKQMGHLQCLFYINNAAHFVVKNAANKAKLGGSLDVKQMDAVRNLQTYASNTLKTALNTTDAGLEQTMLEVFGREVTAHGKQEDAIALAGGILQSYADAALRAALKLSFRKGLAHQWSFTGGGPKNKGELTLYDTADNGDALERGGSLYAMDSAGRIFVSGKEGEQVLKHSSFLAGAATLCAGTMRIDKGQVVWVSGRSGHYQPKVTQIVNFLERLRTYGVNLDKVTVYRENYTNPNLPPNPVWNCFEGVPAMALLQSRLWPGNSPDSMRVG